MDQTRLSLLALHFVPGIGDHLIRQLVSYTGSPEKVFQSTKGRLLRVPGIGETIAQAILTGGAFKMAEAECRLAEQQKVSLIFYTDDHYPARLRQVNDSPTLLYYKGNGDLNSHRTVAIVGTRRATSYGKECIDELMAGLVPFEPLVVSGLAYGIDIWAHKEALNLGMSTVGVLGSGIDVIYPSQHKDTAQRMLEHGGLLTENAFGTKPDAHNFPARNRIIAGLCDALIVVEAGERGGALITADIANSYNKDVFAFPGNVGQSYSSGCNNLIKQNKANLITSAKDLAYIMNWEAGIQAQSEKAKSNFDSYDPAEQSILHTLDSGGGTMQLDELSWKTNVPLTQLASVLLSLEFKGVVASLPGKRYKLCVPVSGHSVF
jgi:DNA processing protein